MKRTLLIRVALIAGLILALGISPAFAGTAARINNPKAQIATTGEPQTLPLGTEVEITAIKNGWAKINYNGNVGCIRVEFLTLKDGITAYVKKSVPAYRYASTASAKTDPLQIGSEVKVVGVYGNFYQVTNGKLYAYITKDALTKTKPSDVFVLAAKVKLIEWAKANQLFPKSSYVVLYDIKSGLTIRAYRLGGSNHAELEPATAEDTQKLLEMSGGEFSWASRPVIVCANGNYAPGSINTMPHGDEVIMDNNFDGQFCLHLLGSKTHESNSINSEHLNAIKAAYAWALAQVKANS